MKSILSIRNEEHLKDWEKLLLRKTDFLSLIGTLNILLALSVFSYFGFTQLNVHFYAVFGLAVLVFISNRFGYYIISTYLFFAIGIYILSMAVLYMRLESNALMYFFPVTMSIVQLLGRKETFHHLIIWVIIYFMCISSLMYISESYVPYVPSEKLMGFLKIFNVLLSFLCGLMLIIIITWTNITQEKQIRKAFKEKELLLAELFHRVKNNLNIVTSLLNIRKNKSDSPEVAEALEECRNRIFSMALVHQQMYSGSNVGNLNLNVYLSELITSIEVSFGGDANVTMEIDDDIHLPIAKAVPTGLILNELLTNVYKHARTSGRELEVNIQVQLKGSYLTVHVIDNGPGIAEMAVGAHHLGLELIRSLSEQIDAKFNLANNENKAGTTATLVIYRHDENT